MITVKDKKIIFSKKLDVKFSGKVLEDDEKEIIIEGEDESSYLKVYNPFKRVAKLLVFENNQWVDTENSSTLENLNLENFDLNNISNEEKK